MSICPLQHTFISAFEAQRISNQIKVLKKNVHSQITVRRSGPRNMMDLSEALIPPSGQVGPSYTNIISVRVGDISDLLLRNHIEMGATLNFLRRQMFGFQYIFGSSQSCQLPSGGNTAYGEGQSKFQELQCSNALFRSKKYLTSFEENVCDLIPLRTALHNGLDLNDQGNIFMVLIYHLLSAYQLGVTNFHLNVDKILLCPTATPMNLMSNNLPVYVRYFPIITDFSTCQKPTIINYPNELRSELVSLINIFHEDLLTLPHVGRFYQYMMESDFNYFTSVEDLEETLFSIFSLYRSSDIKIPHFHSDDLALSEQETWQIVELLVQFGLFLGEVVSAFT